jgi:hypothetical protein
LGLCKVEVDYRESRVVADRRKRERGEGSAGLVDFWQDLMLGFV